VIGVGLHPPYKWLTRARVRYNSHGWSQASGARTTRCNAPRPIHTKCSRPGLGEAYSFAGAARRIRNWLGLARSSYGGEGDTRSPLAFFGASSLRFEKF